MVEIKLLQGQAPWLIHDGEVQRDKMEERVQIWVLAKVRM